MESKDVALLFVQNAVFMLAQVIEFTLADYAACMCKKGAKKTSVEACNVLTYASKWHYSSHELRMAVLDQQTCSKARLFLLRSGQ